LDTRSCNTAGAGLDPLVLSGTAQSHGVKAQSKISLHDAAWAIREAMKVCEEAEHIITARAVGEVLDDTLRHAKDLLDYADEEIVGVDGYGVMVAAAPMLRARLRVLRDKAG